MISKRWLVVFLVMFAALVLLFLVASTFVYDAPLRDEIQQFVVMPDDYLRTVNFDPWWDNRYRRIPLFKYVWVEDCWVYQVGALYHRVTPIKPRMLSPETVTFSIIIFPHPSSLSTPTLTGGCPLLASLAQMQLFIEPEKYARNINVNDESDAIELAQLLTKIGEVQSTASYRVPRFKDRLREDDDGGINNYELQGSRFNVTVVSDIGVLYIDP